MLSACNECSVGSSVGRVECTTISASLQLYNSVRLTTDEFRNSYPMCNNLSNRSPVPLSSISGVGLWDFSPQTGNVV